MRYIFAEFSPILRHNFLGLEWDSIGRFLPYEGVIEIQLVGTINGVRYAISPREGTMGDAHHTFRTLIETGEIIPAFTLPGSDGMPYSPWMYKQQEHLLLLIILTTSSSGARGLLKAFAREYRSFREEDCALLAISADTVVGNLQAQEELQLPFPLLADPKGEVIARYTLWDARQKVVLPSIVLADRYGALYRQWVEEKEGDLVGIKEILEELRYLNRLCTP